MDILPWSHSCLSHICYTKYRFPGTLVQSTKRDFKWDQEMNECWKLVLANWDQASAFSFWAVVSRCLKCDAWREWLCLPGSWSTDTLLMLSVLVWVPLVNGQPQNNLWWNSNTWTLCERLQKKLWALRFRWVALTGSRSVVSYGGEEVHLWPHRKDERNSTLGASPGLGQSAPSLGWL